MAQEPVEDGRNEGGHYQHCDAGVVQAPQPRLQQSGSFSQRRIATSTARQPPWQREPRYEVLLEPEACTQIPASGQKVTSPQRHVPTKPKRLSLGCHQRLQAGTYPGPVPVAAAEQVAEGGCEQAGHGARSEHMDRPTRRGPLRIRERCHQLRIPALQPPQALRPIRQNPARQITPSEPAQYAAQGRMVPLPCAHLATVNFAERHPCSQCLRAWPVQTMLVG